jgi:hypothetical protein
VPAASAHGDRRDLPRGGREAAMRGELVPPRQVPDELGMLCAALDEDRSIQTVEALELSH